MLTQAYQTGSIRTEVNRQLLVKLEDSLRIDFFSDPKHVDIESITFLKKSRRRFS